MKTNLLKRVVLSIVSAGLLLILTMKAEAQNTAKPAPTISDLSWMAGDWQTAPGGRSQTDEHWTHPAGASMLGLSRTVAGGRTYEFEYLRMEQRQDGIYYVAHPKARCPGTDFKLTSVTTSEAVFENPAHDFPKRITYRKTAEGSIVASVEGGPGSKSITFTYLPMKRE